MTKLSIISIVTMDRVSDANAMGKAFRKLIPFFKSGLSVSEYPKKNANIIASMMVAGLLQPNPEPIAVPVISPMAQPVRQCKVA